MNTKKKKLSNVRNQRLNLVNTMAKKLDKGFGITEKDKERAIEVDYVIDADKRTHYKDKPRMTD